MKWIVKQAKKVWPGILLLTVIGSLLSLIGVLFALLSKQVLDIATGQAEGNLIRAGLFMVGLLAVQLLFQIFLSVADVHVKGRFNIRVKTELFNLIMKRDYLKVSAYHSGELLNYINSDVSIIATGLLDMLPNLIFYLTKIVACFCALYVLEPVLAYACLLVGPLIFLVACLYRKRMKGLHKDHQAADGRVKSYMQEALKNLLVIKSFGVGDAASEKSRRLQIGQFKIDLKRNQLSIAANAFFYIGLTAGYYLALAWGAYRISAGLMTFGTLTAVLQLVGQIQSPFQGLSSLLPQYYAMVASAERIMDLEALPEDVTESREDWNDEAWSSFTLSGVSFGYDELILKNADFTVKNGEFSVIMGSSGIGKSTLLKLILGIFPMEHGTAVLKLADGTERPLMEERKRLFAYVPQGNLIVSGTIRENILFFRPDVTEDELIEATKVAQIYDFIKDLPDGFDTVLGEGGLGLSEGQIQRLAISRALVSGAPVLLLDEATSALDEATELAILEALKAQKDKTCVLVSHKKAALDVCDVV